MNLFRLKDGNYTNQKFNVSALLVVVLLLACFAVASMAQSMRGSDVCASGYVWREARPADHVCVTPEARALVRQENSRAPQRWTAGAYGPHTCIQGYVWREAFQGDDVCVTPERRDQVREENRVAISRRASR
jgi:hypothetical protein